MSKEKLESEYKKTKSYRFFTWLNGEKDPYLDQVESKTHAKNHIKELPLQERLKEKQNRFDRVYDIPNNKEIKMFEWIYQVFSALFCIILIIILLITVSNLPRTGNVFNPNNNEVAGRYIEQGLKETGATNIVAGMILDYRAFDTLGESHVLFVAAIIVVILLRIDKKKDKENHSLEKSIRNDRIYEPKNDAILQKIAFVLVPMIMIFGIYVVLNGHLSPGGGFSGGAIIGAGLILYLNAFGFKKTEQFFTEKTFKWVCFGSLSFYCVAKSYSFFTGANNMESHIPKGIPGQILSGGLILPLNIAVGLVVACTMYAFYALFRKGGF
ncbi:MAG TPA: hydrogen gas-evolving membrane-bound hydrogenase subunit E [Lachnospiraceae bacterium]|nr:hydrogen gas-evolving membrane-bound hydrogenase subunit E [Lachnospiraceae bacterium]